MAGQGSAESWNLLSAGHPLKATHCGEFASRLEVGCFNVFPTVLSTGYLCSCSVMCLLSLVGGSWGRLAPSQALQNHRSVTTHECPKRNFPDSASQTLGFEVMTEPWTPRVGFHGLFEAES